jgi:LysR family transcriptional regulator for bpeEF and oprC
MEVFVNIVQVGSFSRAAEHLDMANSSITSCIRNLEAHLGVTLLQRTTRHVHLTDEGAVFYRNCCDILARVEEAEASLSRSKPSGTLRVEVPIALGHMVLGPALVDFSNRYPDLKVIVSLTNDVDVLIRRGVDVAMRMDEVEDGDLIARWIYEANHVLCASPGFLKKHGTPKHPAEIDPTFCMGYVPTCWGSARRWVFRRGDKAVEVKPAGNLQFNSSDALLKSALKDGGLIYVLDVFARTYLEHGELVPILPQWETAKQTFYAVYPQSHFMPPKVACFLEFLTEVFRARPTHESVTVAPLAARR